MNYFLFRLKEQKTEDTIKLKTLAKSVSREVLQMKKDAKATMVRIGASRIEDGSIVYTHCHSSSVTSIIIEAAKTKRIEVYNTETRPRFQGRITAKELAKKNIPVTHFVDAAAKFALRKADVMLIGADAITPTGVFNKIGSGLFVEVAHKYDVPVYVCTTSWKFDPAAIFGQEEVIEKRPAYEVWENAPRGVKVTNYAFEKINPDFIEAIISELGVLKFDTFIEETKTRYPWLFLA